MLVNFVKMHGLGNDFVVIDLITQGVKLNKSHFSKLSDRKLGVGCDQIILLTPPTRFDADFFYKIYNRDGKEAEQCINGLRCAAKYFVDMGLTNKKELVADCLGGTARLVVDGDQITASWQKNERQIQKIDISYPDLPKEIYSLSVGNPHGVLVVDNIDNHKVKVFGKKLSRDPIFQDGANIGFMQVIDRDNIKLRVYERGAGLTFACGSGACAAVLVGHQQNLLNNTVKVKFRLGEVLVSVNPESKSLSLSGPATSVYIGRFKV